MNKKVCLPVALLVVYFSSFCFSSHAQCDNLYQKLWGFSNGGQALPASATLTPANELLVGGRTGTSALLAKFDPSQQLLWAKMYRTGSLTSFKKILQLSDGNIAALGYTTVPDGRSAVCIWKLGPAGNVLWTKLYYDFSAVPGLANLAMLVEGFTETPDGGLAVCGRKRYQRPDNGTNYRCFIFKVDRNGVVNWTREDTKGNDDELFSMLLHQGSLYIVGRSNVLSLGRNCAVFEKLNPATGAVELLKFYYLPSTFFAPSNYFRSIEKSATGFEIGAQGFLGINSRLYFDLHLDEQGSQVKLQMVPPPAPLLNLIDQYYHPVPMPDGGTVLWKNWYHSSTEASLSRILADRSSSWSYEYTRPGKQTMYAVLPQADNSAIAISSSPSQANINGAEKIMINRVASNGLAGPCVANNMPFAVKDSLNYQVQVGSWQTTQLNFDPVLTGTTTAIDTVLVPEAICSTTACFATSMSIKGDSITCDPMHEPVFVASIPGNCTLPVTWTLTPNIGTIIVQNDSTVRVQYQFTGSAVLQARVKTACVDLVASINLRREKSVQSADLGADTSFCTGDTISLVVNNTGNYILWSNNSTAPAIRISAPGTYSVQVSADSVCFARDTIQVFADPLPVVDLGNATVICQSDSLRLIAGNGSNTYLWQDGSASPVLIVKDTGRYSVTVTDRNFCKSSDTIHLGRLAQQPSGFTLFSDSSICAGEKILLKLNSSFVSYNWNNGASSAAAYEVSSPGSYKIGVTTTDGCRGTDSIIVTGKQCIDGIYFPNAFTPNADLTNDIFRPVFPLKPALFEMNIFNRYGQLIYRTRDAEKGWDGKYGGKPQNPGAFVYIARFARTSGAIIEKRSGTFILIR